MKFLIKLFSKLYYSVRDMILHDGIEHAGYLSFLIMVALFPFLFFMMSIIGLIDDNKIIIFLSETIQKYSNSYILDALRPRILELTHSPPQTFVTIAIFGAIWTSSSIFEALRTIINKAYRVTNVPAYILRRMVSFVEFFIAIIVILTVIFLYITLPLFPKFIDSLLGVELTGVWLIIQAYFLEMRQLILVLLGFFILMVLFKFLPNKAITFKQTVPGAIFTVFGWYVASLGFRYYIFNFPQVNLIYGSIASVIIALLYFYISSMVFIIGAEFNYHMSKNK
jgi:membrane protein